MKTYRFSSQQNSMPSRPAKLFGWISTLNFLAFLMLPIATHAVEIHVSPDGNDQANGSAVLPLQSPEAARNRAREIRQSQPEESIEIVFQAGRYAMDQALVLDQRDGGSMDNPIVWRTAGAGPVVWTGGESLSGGTLQGDRFRIPLPQGVLPEQLILRGRTARPASEPDPGESCWRFEAVLHSGDNPNKMFALKMQPHPIFEMDWIRSHQLKVSVLKIWSDLHARVSAINTEQRQIFLDPDTYVLDLSSGRLNHGARLTSANGPDRYRVYLYGHPNCIDEPGEWAVDEIANEIVYYPYPGEDLATLNPVIPKQEQLLVIKGSTSTPVEFITFEDIIFSDTEWVLPANGFDDTQAQGNYHSVQSPPKAAVDISNAQGIVLQGITLQNLAGHGVAIGAGAHDCKIVNSTLTDIGATGIRIGRNSDTVLAHEQTRSVEVQRCRIARCGQILRGAVGIWNGFSVGSRIVENAIHDVPYSGISAGWKWNAYPSSSQDHQISGNRIARPLQQLSDGAAIYVLGAQPNSIISDNLIEGIHRHPHAPIETPVMGIYTDQGSAGWEIARNVIGRNPDYPFFFHRPGNVGSQGQDRTLESAPPIKVHDNYVAVSNTGYQGKYRYLDELYYFPSPNNHSDKMMVEWSDNTTISDPDLQDMIDQWLTNHPEVPFEGWAGFPFIAPQQVKTENFLGHLYIDEFSDWVYSVSLSAWVFLPESNVRDDGAWVFIPWNG